MNLTSVVQQRLPANLTLLKSLLRSKRHFNFVGSPTMFEKCYQPAEYGEAQSEACDFITKTSSCSRPVILFNYLQFMVCYLHVDNSRRGVVLGCIITTFIFFIYAIWMYVISKYFILPNCLFAVKHLKMKDYNIGVVILSTIFVIPEAIMDGMMCYNYSDTYAMMHTQCIAHVLGQFVTIFILLGYYGHNVTLNGVIFLREMILIFVGSSILFSTLLREMYNAAQITVNQTNPVIVYITYGNITVYFIYILSVFLLSEPKTEKAVSAPENNKLTIIDSDSSLKSDEYPCNNPISYEINPWKIILTSMAPSNLNIKSTSLKYFLFPFYLVLSLIIPVVRPELPLFGWSKILFCLSILSCPLYFMSNDLSTYAWAGVIIFCTICIIVVMMLTNSRRRPKHHDLISLWGILISFLIANSLVAEVQVLCWQSLHYLAAWEEDTVVLILFPLTCTFYQAIFLRHLIKHKRHELSFGFAMGSVIGLLYSDLPLVVFSLCENMTEYFLITSTTYAAFIYLFVILTMTVFSVLISGYQIRLSHTVFFFSIVLVFFVYLLLIDVYFVHSYGVVHAEKVNLQNVHAGWA